MKQNRTRRLALSLCALILGLALGLGGMRTAEAETRILALGDSLTAGQGVRPGEDFATRLEHALREAGEDVKVVNAGISGDTTTGGLRRMPALLSPVPDLIVLELGVNDVLHGITPDQTWSNLVEMVSLARAQGTPVLLAGIGAIPGAPDSYAQRFESVYPRLAALNPDLGFYPDFLDGVAGRPEFNQPDGFHPNAHGVDRIVQGIAPMLRDMIKTLKQKEIRP